MGCFSNSFGTECLNFLNFKLEFYICVIVVSIAFFLPVPTPNEAEVLLVIQWRN